MNEPRFHDYLGADGVRHRTFNANGRMVDLRETAGGWRVTVESDEGVHVEHISGSREDATRHALNRAASNGERSPLEAERARRARAPLRP